MQRFAWTSPHTGVEMPVLRFGHWGPPLIYVPSSGGDEREFQAYGFDAICGPWIAEGRVQVFSIDGHGPRALFNDSIDAPERMRRHVALERYAADELLPFVEDLARNPYLGVLGSSYGAFVAANLLLRNAGRVQVACGLGGVYGLWHRLDGYSDESVREYTPLDYLPMLEGTALDAVQGTKGLVMFAAERDPWLLSSRAMAGAMRERALPHVLEVDPAPADHHERWWRPQLRHFLERYF